MRLMVEWSAMLALPVALFIASNARADDLLNALVESLQKKYDSVESMSANFEQSYKSMRFEEDKKASGTLEIQKPGKMRWDYREPKGKLLVSDGETLSLYDPQDKQVVVNRQPKGQSLPAAIAFLAGKGKLKESFAMEWIAKPNEARKAVIRATPKSKEPNVREIHFTVSLEGSPTIVATSIVDELGGESQVSFRNIKINPKLSAKRFEFKAPKGVTIVEPKI